MTGWLFHIHASQHVPAFFGVVGIAADSHSFDPLAMYFLGPSLVDP